MDHELAGASYLDRYEAAVSPSDPRTAEQVVRSQLGDGPRWVRVVVRFAWRYVLLFDLGPDDADHVAGGRVVERTPERLRFEASGPLVTASVLALRVSPERIALSTAVRYERTAGRVVWVFVGPVHRLVSRYLIHRASRDVST